jgi:hypothetical protein
LRNEANASMRAAFKTYTDDAVFVRGAPMKPAVAFVIFLACCGILLGNQTSPDPWTRGPSRLLDDLVQMTRAGSSDAEVLAYARAHRRELPSEVSDRDLRYLQESGVSARVVSYMSAIDVRASDEQLRESPVYPEDSVPPRGSYSSPTNPYPQGEDVPYGNGDVNGYVSNSPYPDGYGGPPDYYAGSPYGYGGYPYGYGSGYCDPYYDFGCYYPYYGYGYYNPYPLYYFFPFFGHGFHDHHHDHHGHVDHHGHDGGHQPGSHGNMIARSDPREAWRERGFNASSRRPAIVAPRGSARTAFARHGSTAAPRGFGRAPISRGFAPSAPAHPGVGSLRGPAPNFRAGGSISRPSFSGGGARGFSGGGMRGSGGGFSGTRGGRH